MQLKKQTKTIENRIDKQILDADQNSITNLFSKDVLCEKAIYELNKIKKIEQQINKDNF